MSVRISLRNFEHDDDVTWNVSDDGKAMIRICSSSPTTSSFSPLLRETKRIMELLINA